MQVASASTRRTLGVAAAAAAGAALVGLGLAGWLDDGARLFMTLAEAGLSWCF